MKTKDLIKQLKKLNPDLEIFIDYPNYEINQRELGKIDHTYNGTIMLQKFDKQGNPVYTYPPANFIRGD